MGDAGLAVAATFGDAKLGEMPTNASGTAGQVSFLKTASTGSIYNSHSLQTSASPYHVMAGTVLSASLLTGLNSDLPGMVIAQLSEPVFDTVSGRILLAPAGTRVLGEYDSQIAFGQSRALVVWKRLILPNGSSLEIDNLPARIWKATPVWPIVSTSIPGLWSRGSVCRLSWV
jgi:type IV secretion system protein VirB10